MNANQIGEIVLRNQGGAITFDHITDGPSAVGVVRVNLSNKSFTYISGQDLAMISSNPTMAKKIWEDSSRHRTMEFREIANINY